jgi:general stress protein 26
VTQPPARDRARRLRDTLAILEQGVDCWVATASAEHGPHLVPLSFAWQDGRITLATPARYRTVENLRADPEVRLAFGSLRDVVMIHGTAEVRDLSGVPDEVVDGYVAQAGWDPRDSDGNAFVEITPRRVLAWRQENELEGRVLMRDGDWLDGEVGS